MQSLSRLLQFFNLILISPNLITSSLRSNSVFDSRRFRGGLFRYLSMAVLVVVSSLSLAFWTRKGLCRKIIGTHIGISPHISSHSDSEMDFFTEALTPLITVKIISRPT